MALGKTCRFFNQSNCLVKACHCDLSCPEMKYFLQDDDYEEEQRRKEELKDSLRRAKEPPFIV